MNKTDRTRLSSFNEPIFIIMTLKKQLRLYLEKRDLTAAQLAKKAQVPKQSLSGWMAGSNPRDVRQVKRVAEVLGTTIDHLMFGEGAQSDSAKVGSLESLLTDDWVGGVFEIKLRRIKR